MPETGVAADLDLRLVRSFVAVAEHRTFGRAAAALYITQPALSRQVRRLERLVGAALLDRGPSGTHLTAAGAAFLPEARALLRSAAQAAAAARAAAPSQRLAVGYTTGLVMTPLFRRWRQEQPGVELVPVHLEWDRPAPALLDGQVDVAVARLPFDTGGLSVTVLYDEPRVLLVASDHPLAGRPGVTLDDIATEPIPRVPDPVWDAYWRVDPRPGGRPAPGGPLVHHLEEKLEHIASGTAVAIVSAGLRAEQLHPGLTTVPLEGVDPARVVVATRAGRRSPAVREFVALAGATLATGREHPLAG